MTALDVPGEGNALDFDPARRAAIVLIDGLGARLLADHANDAPFLTSHVRDQTFTTGFPSTTVTSLTSIGTGATPGAHGLVGYTFAVDGHDRCMNAIQWELYGNGPRLDLRDEVIPEAAQPHATAFERATKAGIESWVLAPANQAQSGLSRAALRGARFVPVFSTGDLIAETARALASSRRTFVYAYHGSLDATGHVRGPGTPGWRAQLSLIDSACERLAQSLPGDAVLVVTGDHGMVRLTEAQRLDVADHPELMVGVRLLGGEARARHVYCKPGAVADARAAWEAVLGDRMWVLSRDEAVEAGWFGPSVTDAARRRIGDVVAAAHGPVGVMQRAVDSRQAELAGHHGSMTDAEQLVPLIEVRR